MFRPNFIVNHFSQADIAFLEKQKITLLLCDIDNTLAKPEEKYPSKEVFEYIKLLKKANIEVILISNNKEIRVGQFAKDLKIPYISFALKPLWFNFCKIKKKYPQHKIAILGDQLLTDVLGGNCSRITTILTKPLVKNDLAMTKINRFFERIIMKLLKIGDQYEK